MVNFNGQLEKIHIPFFSYLDVYFDLGTSYTRIAVKDKGIVVREPTVLGLNKKVHEYMFFGREAKQIIGKVPDFIQIDKPVQNSIIANFDGEVALLQSLLTKAVSPYLQSHRFFKPALRAGVAIPTIATEIEQRAVEEILYKIGMSRVTLYEKSMITAVGCGFNVFLHQPVCIVDMGGGIIEISVISGGGTVIQKTLKNAGEHMNKLIYNYLYLKYGIVLGETTIEDTKIILLNFIDEEKTETVRGKSLETGLPKAIKVKSSDIREALLGNFNQVLDTIKEVIELSPPEVVDELYKNGIILTGGIANAPGIDKFFKEELKIDVKIAEQKDTATVSGLMRTGRRKDYKERLQFVTA